MRLKCKKTLRGRTLLPLSLSPRLDFQFVRSDRRGDLRGGIRDISEAADLIVDTRQFCLSGARLRLVTGGRGVDGVGVHRKLGAIGIVDFLH